MIDYICIAIVCSPLIIEIALLIWVIATDYGTRKVFRKNKED